MASPHTDLHFVLFPLMSQGHLIPMVDMARILAQRGAIVTIVTTPVNAKRFKPVIDRAIEAKLQILFLELPLPLDEVGLPEGCENFDSLPSHAHALNMYSAMNMLENPAEISLKTLCTPPSCIISDSSFPWTINIAKRLNIPRLIFYGPGCFAFLCMHILTHTNILNEIDTNSEYFAIPGLPDRIEVTKPQAFHLGFEELEPKYVEAFTKAKNKKVWCIGPVSLCNKSFNDLAERGNKAAVDGHNCIKWLDSREPGSVVYVCLGSLSYASTEQAIEIGLGLELSNLFFIWFIRNTTDEYERWLLEEGYEERVKDRGLMYIGMRQNVHAKEGEASWSIENKPRNIKPLCNINRPRKAAVRDDTARSPALHAIQAGHWKRNCPQYLAELMKKKKNTASGAGGSGSKGYGLEIVLNNCHYAPSITSVIFVSRLYEDGFVNRFVNNTIQVSRNNVVYFCAIPRDGIFEIDLSNSLTNESSVYDVSNKRAKLNLDSAFLWHCRLRHISKKCIEKLQHEGLLNSSDLTAFEKCVSCMSENQLGKTIKSLRSDRGGEYMSQEFLDHLKDHGIIAHRTPPYTPQHNGVSERRNKTLLGMVRSLMSQTTLPKSFWDYALETAARILNMVPTKKVEKTPYEVWHGKVPKLSYLKVWGCEALVKRDTLTKPDKLEPRAIKCIFVGYPKETMGYSFYYQSENKVLVARNAEFLENSLIDQEASGSLEDLEVIQEEDAHPSLDTSLNHEEDDLEIDEPQSDIVPIRRSTRTRHAPDRMCLYIDAEEHELGDLGEPANYKAALSDPESEKWLNAMNVEMQSMKDNEVWVLVELPPNGKAVGNNEVWVLVELPPNGKTVGSKWLFKKKTDMDGNVHIYKARLVAKGFTQTPGIDYEETFSPVADIRAIRILIAIAAYYDYEIWQIDVKTAFLNGYLKEEVYMEQPEGFVDPKYPNCVCKLKRSIYGLKEASRQWNKRFDDEIKSIPMLQSVKTYLGKCFAMKDLGEAAYILGIKIYRDISKRLIGLCQSAYIEKILKRSILKNSKRRSIPMQEKLKLSKSQGASTPAEMKRMQNVPYASAVGSIMYAVRCTRPDVAFAQNITSRFQQNPGDIHWTTVKNILKYLRNTKDMFLVYGGDLKRELRVSCYTDAGYLTDADDLKSQTGYVFVLNGGAVDWKSTKQSIFATSSAEAKYIAAFDASKEAVWVRKFISGLSVVPTIEEPISMYCDNTGAIAIANESEITKGARYFHAKVHYLREVIEFGDIKLEKVSTDDNLADPFTKALAFPKHSEHIKNIGMLPASSLM
nr:retrotransposon protein, putative, Ty1-copia subclass [Tanacetum cinerariifolium]